MRITHGKPRYSGLFSLFVEYSSLGRTNTQRESAGLERVLSILGLDRILSQEGGTSAARLCCTVEKAPVEFGWLEF